MKSVGTPTGYADEPLPGSLSSSVETEKTFPDAATDCWLLPGEEFFAGLASRAEGVSIVETAPQPAPEGRPRIARKWARLA